MTSHRDVRAIRHVTYLQISNFLLLLLELLAEGVFLSLLSRLALLRGLLLLPIVLGGVQTAGRLGSKWPHGRREL